MKEKVIAAIKAKFPTINLSSQRLDAIAAKIAQKIGEDETLIDAKIDDFNDLNPFADIAKQDDQIRNLQTQLKKSEKKDTDPPAPPSPPSDETPEWAKGFATTLQTMADKITTLEGEKVQERVKTSLSAKLKDVPQSYWGKRPLPQESEVEKFIEDVKTDYNSFVQEMTEKGLSVLPTPGSGGKTPSKATEDEVNSIVNAIM